MKRRKISIFKQVFLVLTLLVFIGGIGASSPTPAFAEKDSQRVDQGIVDAFEREQMGEFKDGGRNYYYLDSVTERDAKKAREDSVWENIKDKLFGWTDFSGNFMDKFNTFLNMIVNMAFKMNLFMTNTMIMVLDFAFDIDIIGVLVHDLQNSIQDMTGISGGKFLGGGLFGGLIKMVAVLAVLYMLYVFIIRRAFLESIGSLMKTVVTLSLSLLLFSNYATFISGAQSITHDATRYIIGLTTWNENSNITVDSNTKTTMKDSLWTMFVDRPYLYMQYGTHDVGQIGKSRVEDLLKTPTGEDRYEKVLTNEVAGHNNDFMVHSSVLDRLSFSAFYLVVNGIVSMPIFMLAILLIVLQFWFLIIAAIAPFALLVASIPGFFGVLKRYAIEFVIPLGLKVFFAFFTVLLLVLSDALFSMSIAQRYNAQSIIDYIAVGVFHFVLFITLFLLRKRISNIFASGSQMIAGLREASGPVNPFTIAKKGVQGTATVAGVAVGAAVAGPAGAAMGASIGSTAGRAVTGEAGVAEVASATSRAANFSKLSKLSDARKNIDFEIGKEKKEDITEFMKGKGFDDQTIKDTIDAFEKNGLQDVSQEEIEEQYEKMAKDARGEELDKDFSQVMAAGIKEQRADNRIKEQQRILEKEQKPTETSENAARFFHEKGAHHATLDVVGNLEKAGLKDVSMEEMEAQYARMQTQFDKGKFNGDFASEFATGIQEQRMQDANYESHERIFANAKSEIKTVDNGAEQPSTVKSIPMENNDMELKSLYDQEPRDTTSMDTKPMDESKDDSRPVQDGPMDVGPIPNRANNQNTNQSENTPIGSNPIQTAGYSSKQSEVRPMDGQKYDTSGSDAPPMEHGSLDGTKLDQKGLDSTPVTGNSTTGGRMDSTSLNESDMNATPLDQNSMKGEGMSGTNMDVSPMGETPLQGNTMDTKPMENESLAGKEMNTNPVGNNPVSGNHMDAKKMESGDMGGNKFSDSPMNNNPIGGSQMESKPLDKNEVKGGGMESRPMGDNPLGNNQIESKPLESNPLGGSKMETTPMGGREMKGSSIEGSPMGGSEMKGSSMSGSSMESSSLEGTSMNSTSMQGQGMDAKPLEQSSFGGSTFEAKPIESNRTMQEPSQSTPASSNLNNSTQSQIPETERLNPEQGARNTGENKSN
ncbi:CD3337/EF1877 family mobilome membrane protein [Siminovitchia thermophila]|uniref:CD3337/EF1877 family mobilome membrane protein n=1 Tax=Siminovitchia thermophila TaxID=1245522 RepID=UPI0038B6167A